LKARDGATGYPRVPNFVLLVKIESAAAENFSRTVRIGVPDQGEVF
jgi:hypothetical protein